MSEFDWGSALEESYNGLSEDIRADVEEDALPTEGNFSDEDESMASDRSRDERGRFAAKQAAEADEGAPAAAAPTPEMPDPTSEFPNSWKRELAEKWGTLDPAVRAEIHRREQNFHGELGRYRQAVDYAQKWADNSDVVQRLRNDFGDETLGVKKLLELSDFAGQNPQDFIAWFAQVNNIDLPAEFLNRPQAPRPAGLDPQILAMQRELHELKTARQQELQFAQQQQNSEAVRLVTEFGKDKADFAQLRPTMAELLAKGFANGLEDAYTKARALTQPQVDVEAEVARRLKESESKQAARKVNLPRTGSDERQVTRKRSMEDTLRELSNKLF